MPRELRHERNRLKPSRAHLRALAALGVAAVLGGAVAAVTITAIDPGGTTTIVREATSSSDPVAATSTDLSVNAVYRRASKGVVEITVSSASAGGFGGQQQSQAQGSGFVIDKQGHVVTNQHVVDGATSVSVQMWNGSTYDATVVGTDPSTDLAVLKLDAPASALHPLTVGDSDALEVGDGVVAIGSPFGLEETVTAGIVSALHRSMTSPNGFAIEDSIQTDAAINHGNSGGPLLNRQGMVIGVNSQIQSDSGGNEGVGFAVPSNTVRSVVAQILSSGSVDHAYLGVGIDTISSQAADELSLPEGAAVTEVRTGTPAADAGLKGATGSESVGGTDVPTGGDVITAVDGKTVRTAEELRRAVDARKPGDTVKLTVVRDGKERTVTVELGTRPSA
jgi:putative serine protease PepD